MNHVNLDNNGELWAVVCLVMVLAILVHGLTASGMMGWLDRCRRSR